MLTVDHLNAAVKAIAKSKDWAQRADDEIAAAYVQDGHSLSRIAGRIGLTIEAVRQRLLARGVTLRARGGRN